MKTKKGFTMVELLAVIVIISIILTIISFAVSGVMKKNKQAALEAKKEIILKQARQYGQDYEELFYNSSKRYKSKYVCTQITVGTLVTAGYIDEDDKDTSSGEKDVVNPQTGESMKNMKIVIYIKAKDADKSPLPADYNSLGIYNGPVISIFDNETGNSKCQ